MITSVLVTALSADRTLVSWIALIVNWRVVVKILVLVHFTSIVLKQFKNLYQNKD